MVPFSCLFFVVVVFVALKSIQRRLEEIEVTFKELEDKGIVLERTLRGEAGEGRTLMGGAWS